MTWRSCYLPLLVVGLALAARPALAQDDDLNALQEKAIKAAAKEVAPCVVQIETTGGTETVSSGPGGKPVRKGFGPTTGLIVGADGFVISSSFNFANNPTAIFVAVPGHKERYVAKKVATDTSRMLTLLKIDAKDLPIPKVVPKKEFMVGQWAIALGRTLNNNLDQPPSVSAGIISAINRIWGKAIQTDAKISPVNYGGPLVDISGKVQGVIVPAAPRGEGETAGVDWYDSGIGFAVPLEDIFTVLPRMKEGKDLRKGLLGITPKSQDIFSAAPEIGAVAPNSTAAKAGIQVGDVIIEVDGTAVERQAQVMHLLGYKYEGDTVSVKVRRDKEEKAFNNLTLGGALSSFEHAFLGVLPMRDDPELGVEIRYVFPKSPAATAGLKAGDRIMKVGSAGRPMQAFSGRDQFLQIMNNFGPDSELKLEFTRDKTFFIFPLGPDKPQTVSVKLAAFSDIIPEDLPENSTYKRALAPRKMPGPGPKPGPDPKPEQPPKEDKKPDKKKVETGLLKRTNQAGDRKYWVFVPENYSPNVAHALVVWMHAPGKPGKDAEDMKDIWETYCEDQHIILVGPHAENEVGWLASEYDAVVGIVREVLGQYTIDRQRVVAHGMDVGGQMAFYLGFNARDTIRGVAVTGAVLNTQVKENTANQRLAFFLIAGGKDPIAKEIAASKDKLTDRKFPAIHREIPDMGHQYLDRKTLKELIRWIDSLDRM